jgi:hypothetical protein
MNCNCQRSNQHHGGINRTLDRFSGDLVDTNWIKLMVVGRGGNIMPDSVKCMLHIRREVKQGTYVNSALFHFTKGVSLRNTIQELLDCLHAVSSVFGSAVSSMHSNCKQEYNEG